MNDSEFAEELVARLNLFISANPDRAHATLFVPLSHAGYASVGHFVGQLAMPRNITSEATAEDLKNVKFVAPVLEGARIVRFETVTGAELQRRHAAATADEGQS